MGGCGDHRGVVGAQVQRRHRQPRPASHHLGRSLAQQGVRRHASADNDFGISRPGKGNVELLEQRLHHRQLERRGEVGALLRPGAFAKVAQAVQEGGLEAAEAVLEAGERRAGQRLPFRAACPRQPVERRPARISEPQHPRRLVESFAGCIVAGAADDLETSMLRHQHQVGVGAADDEPQQWGFKVRAGEHRCVDVSPQVIDACERTRPCRRQPFRHADADQQTARQARASGHRHQVKVARADAGTLEGQVKEVWKAFQMVACGELGDHATKLGVKFDLRVDDVGEHAPPIGDHGDRGFIAAGLYGEG